MDALQFAYWLQGFAELSGDEPPTPSQWKSIREHLGLVFKKVTPPMPRLDPKDYGQAIPQMLPNINPTIAWPRQTPMTPNEWANPLTVRGSGGVAAATIC